MAFDQRGLDDYIDVAQRIADFRERYPEGSLQPADPGNPWEQAIVSGVDKAGKAFTSTMIVYTAAAYRTPDDPRPGIGVAWEVFPGRTPYTLGSELQNAETSAWGRAIIAVGASDSKRGIASREEVRNRRAERDDGLPVNADGSLSRSRTSDAEKDAAGVLTSTQHAEHTALRAGATTGKVKPGERLTAPDPDDPWAGVLPGQFEPSPITEERSGTIDGRQKMLIVKGFAAVGITTADARHEAISGVLGRTVDQTKDLSMAEAATVLANLDARSKTDA